MGDAINGIFEMGGAFAIVLSIVRVVRDRDVAGIAVLHVSYFTAWGLWNLYYYPSLGQTLSFVAGVAVVVANLVWISLLIRYRRRS